VKNDSSYNICRSSFEPKILISSEFSKYANEYGHYNIIQKKVAQHLLSKVISKPKNILDLGCGSGALCERISWEYDSFLGIDFAPNMLELHPHSSKIKCHYGDFNDPDLFEELSKKKYDSIFSASALQWAEDLEFVFSQIKKLQAPIALAIFTSNTFKTLNDTAGVSPLLRSAEDVHAMACNYFELSVEKVEYKLEFDSVREMFRYIKKSGVSGSRKILDYKSTKRLMQEYPLNYLEFEVLFLTSL
jgi:malonyl-CoA O-methyltransferase